MAHRIFQLKAKLIKNAEVAKKYYKIILSCPRICRFAQPGQFIEIKVSQGPEPLLRRPFSIHRVSGANNIEILYEAIGQGTEILSQRKAGEYLDIIGPLGTGFVYHPDYFSTRLGASHLAILVAGGIGVAPLMFLAQEITKSKIQNPKSKILVLIGAKTKNQILCTEEFRELGCQVKIATDDGSKGFKGRVTDLFEEILCYNSRTQELKNSIYACGPSLMLKEITRLSQEYNILAQVSLEEHMACGIGVCLGCVTKTKDGLKRVCKEGPVFDAGRIVW